MRWIVRLVVLLVCVLPLAMVALLFLAVEERPLVARKVVFTPENIERAVLLMKRNDPREMRPDILRTLSVSGEDLDLAVNYLASRYAKGSANLVLQDGAANARMTFELPANPVGRYVNLDATLTETSYLPNVEKMRVGRVPVPAFLCNWLVRQAMARLERNPDYAAAADVVKQVSAKNGMLRVVFVWNDAVVGNLHSALVSTQDQQRWRAYQDRLVEWTAQPGLARQVPLSKVMTPLLQLSAQRAAATGNAAAENRAALIVLAFYVNGKGPAALVPTMRDWPVPTALAITLAGRGDTPQHFTISAALAVAAGSPLADAVGLYKEVDDSRGGGSGFSFNDLAADRAGTRLGELATAGDAGVARLYRAATQGLRESDLLPDIGDLPEFMPEVEFKQRFGGIGKPPYLRMMADIERRIAALPLYR